MLLDGLVVRDVALGMDSKSLLGRLVCETFGCVRWT